MSGGGGGGGEYEVQLNLVPLIDILTNILFFLLMGFASVDQTYEGNLMLPSADAEAKVSPAVKMSLSRDQLLVEDIRVADLKDSHFETSLLEGDKLIPLYEKLNQVRKEQQQHTAGIGKNDDVIWLMADRAVPFSVLSPVMKTAAMAGYPNFQLAVIKK